MTDTPRIRVTIAAPPEEVWKALRERERIRNWHGWEFHEDADGSLDREIETIYFTDVEIEDGVLHLNGGDRIDVDAVDGATHVTLTRAARSGDPDWDAYYDDITEGWTTFLQQLRFAIEHHPHGTRRTVVLRGRSAQDPRQALGAFSDEGEHYRDVFPDGDASGTVWFRSAHQTGLVVDGWGPGLAIATYDRATRATMVLLSLYDVDEQRRDEIGERWGSWWRNHLSDVPQASNEP